MDAFAEALCGDEMIDIDRIDLTPPDPNETDVTILKDEPYRFDSDLSAFDHFLGRSCDEGGV